MTSAVNQIIEVGFDNGWQYNFAITCTLYNFWIYRNLVIISTFLQKHNVASELWTCTLCFLWCGQTSPMLFKLGFPTASPPCRPALHGGATPGLIPRRSKKVVSFDSVNLPSGKCCWKVWKFLQVTEIKGWISPNKLEATFFQQQKTIITWRWWIFPFLELGRLDNFDRYHVFPPVWVWTISFISLVKPWVVFGHPASGIVTGSNQPYSFLLTWVAFLCTEPTKWP